jgi:ribonucleoside-diphosphate reductase alpha chain
VSTPSADISHHVWNAKYRLVDAGTEERMISQTWERVATALAAVETDPTAARSWAERFFGILRDFKFLPGGRIQAGAGTKRNVTLFNCFVMGTIEDSISGIFRALQEGAVTMQWGGGIGCDFSTLRRHAGERRRQHRIRTRIVHANLGCDVRHNPIHRGTQGRHDGDPAL